LNNRQKLPIIEIPVLVLRPSLPSSRRPAFGCRSHDRRGGETVTCELNVTQWLTARHGRSRPYVRASMSDLS